MLFSEIVGHDDLKKRLIQSVNENRVAHAQLFVGTEGSGKMALAIAYAQYINCQTVPNQTAAACALLVRNICHYLTPTCILSSPPQQIKA